MKILVFTDIHGSYNSLKELEKTSDYKAADKIIFLGDVIFGASRINQCVEFLDRNNIICLKGNNDFYISDYLPKVDFNMFSKTKELQYNWMKNTLTDKNKQIIKNWAKSYELIINDKKFYFTHYPWEIVDGEEVVIDCPTETNLQSLQEIFKDIDADYYIYGHEHTKSYFADQNKHYYCVGTLGLKTPSNYLMINIDGEEIKLESKIIEFDINEEIELMDKAGYPYNKNKIKRKIIK